MISSDFKINLQPVIKVWDRLRKQIQLRVFCTEELFIVRIVVFAAVHHHVIKIISMMMMMMMMTRMITTTKTMMRTVTMTIIVAQLT